ncbi:MAG: MBL fold metallo-hydrolase, partial [Tumebacillaceae bacterium]
AAASLRRVAEEVTQNEIHYVVNSHWHGDHVLGNQVFRDATILSTAKTREWMATKMDLSDVDAMIAAFQRSMVAMEEESKQHPSDSIFAEDVRLENEDKSKMVEALPNIKLTLPTVTFEDSLLLHGSKRSVQLLSYGGGHTLSDAFLYLPEDKVAFMGDLVTVGYHPFLGAGQPWEWLTILERVLELDIETVISGHGVVGTREHIELTHEYVAHLIELVEAAVERGETLEQVLSMPIPERYATWRVPHVFKPNLYKLYKTVSEERAAHRYTYL